MTKHNACMVNKDLSCRAWFPCTCRSHERCRVKFAFRTSSWAHIMSENELSIWLKEYKRPWKLCSLAIGLSLLIAGSRYYRAPDWDIPISVIMAIFAYTTAPWSMRVLVKRQWKNIPLMLFLTWFSVDGSYWLYWRLVNPQALALMRDVNFPASLVLYGTCGLVWYYQGSLAELFSRRS